MNYTTSEKAEQVFRNVKEALNKSPYAQEVIICAATKTRSPEEINLLPSLGITHIGENRVQELLEKYDALDKDRLKIHFIGALQTNKVKYIIDKVCMIQSVDRLALAEEIDKQAKKRGIIMDVLCEINVGAEESKSGILPENACEFAAQLTRFPNLRLCGVMAVPPICTDFEVQKQYFQKIMQIFIDIRHQNMDNNNMRILSFGMSGDYPLAIECGSTMIRVGTALFGPRNYKK